MEKHIFKVGDYVMIKAETPIDNLEKANDWCGQIEEINEEDNTCLIALDAKTLNTLPNAYLIVADENGENAAKYVLNFLI